MPMQQSTYADGQNVNRETARGVHMDHVYLFNKIDADVTFPTLAV